MRTRRIGGQADRRIVGSARCLASSLPRCPAALLVLLVALACSPGVGNRDAAGLPDSSYVMQRLGGNALVVRRGFRVGVFAEDLDGVRFMAVGPDGQIYASITGSGRMGGRTRCAR
jgi:hypothetical protein